MSFADRIGRALDSIFLVMFMVWTLGIAVALLSPQHTRERTGVVEVYSLVAVDSGTTGA